MTAHDIGSGRGHGPRVAVDDLVVGLGGGLLVVAVGDGRTEVDAVTVAEPGLGVLGQVGDLLLGIGVDTVPAAVDLLAEAVERNVAAMVLRRSTARAAAVRTAAEDGGVVLLELSDQASW